MSRTAWVLYYLVWIFLLGTLAYVGYDFRQTVNDFHESVQRFVGKT